MNPARTQRLIREALGPDAGDEVSFPERTIATVALVTFALLVAVALTPSRDGNRVNASSAIDVHASESREAPSPTGALVIDGNATEGNVQDMTY